MRIYKIGDKELNKKTRALSTEEFELIIKTMKNGFTHNGVECKPNNRIATILIMQANLGIRIGDLLKLRPRNIIKEGKRYRLNIIEEKTGKSRTFTVPGEVCEYLINYYKAYKIRKNERIFNITERAIQKHLSKVCKYLKLDGVSTHSFRKFFATSIYLNNNYDIVLVQKLLQHSNINITQRYIGLGDAKIETALNNHIYLP